MEDSTAAPPTSCLERHPESHSCSTIARSRICRPRSKWNKRNINQHHAAHPSQQQPGACKSLWSNSIAWSTALRRSSTFTPTTQQDASLRVDGWTTLTVAGSTLGTPKLGKIGWSWPKSVEGCYFHWPIPWILSRFRPSSNKDRQSIVEQDRQTTLQTPLFPHEIPNERCISDLPNIYIYVYIYISSWWSLITSLSYLYHSPYYNLVNGFNPSTHQKVNLDNHLIPGVEPIMFVTTKK